MVNVTSLVRHLLLLRARAHTGSLLVRSGDLSASLYLRAGEVVFAIDHAGETLGKMLVRQGALDEAQHDAVVAKLEAGATARPHRFAELVMELGLLPEARVVKALTEQTRATIMRIIRRAGEVTWENSDGADVVFGPSASGQALRNALAGYSVNLEELVLETVRWIDDEQKNELGLFEVLGQKLGVRVEARAAVARRFALGRSEEDFLLRLDGRRTLAEVLAASRSVDGPALLTAFLMTSTLEHVEPPMNTAPPPAPSVAPPPKPVTVAPPKPVTVAPPKPVTAPPPKPVTVAPPKPVTVAPPKPVTLPPPTTATAAPRRDASVPPSPSAARSISVGRMAATAGAPTPPPPPAVPSSFPKADEKRPGSIAPGNDAKILAGREFKAALELFKASKYAEASGGFNRAAQLQPASSIYRLYAKWCGVVQKPGPVPSEERAETMRLALSAIAMDGDSAFAHYIAGAVAQDDGKRAMAVKYLAEAVRLDPQLADAIRRLRALERAGA